MEKLKNKEDNDLKVKKFVVYKHRDHLPKLTIAVSVTDAGEVYAGLSLCNDKDTFCRKKGRMIAENRLEAIPKLIGMIPEKLPEGVYMRNRVLTGFIDKFVESVRHDLISKYRYNKETGHRTAIQPLGPTISCRPNYYTPPGPKPTAEQRKMASYQQKMLNRKAIAMKQYSGVPTLGPHQRLLPEAKPQIIPVDKLPTQIEVGAEEHSPA